MQHDNPITWGGLQEHQTPRNDGISPALTAAMGMGGGQTPIFTERSDSVAKVGQISSDGSQCGSVFSDDGNMATLTAGTPGNANPHILTDEITNEERNAVEILRVLRQENGEEEFFEWAIRGLWCILAEKTSQSNIYAGIILERWRNTTATFRCVDKKYKFFDIAEEDVRNMWQDWQTGCIQRKKLSDQQSRQLDDFTLKMPHDDALQEVFAHCLRKTGQGIELLQQALSEVQKIWKPNDYEPGTRTSYRIRKLTPRETWRLMGFSDSDFDKAQKVNSNTQLYKQSGNSIVKNVLMAIFGQMIPGKEDIYKEKGSDTAK